MKELSTLFTLTLNEDERYAALRAIKLAISLTDVVLIAKSFTLNKERLDSEWANRMPIMASLVEKLGLGQQVVLVPRYRHCVSWTRCRLSMGGVSQRNWNVVVVVFSLGGTSSCVSYARKVGREVINLFA